MLWKLKLPFVKERKRFTSQGTVPCPDISKIIKKVENEGN